MQKKGVTPLDEKFDKIKAAARQAGQNAYEVIALYVHTAIKNTNVKTHIIEGLQKFIFRFGKRTDELKKQKQNSHEIWTLFCRISQIKDLARNVFHGSVLNDILEASHFSLVFVDAIESLAQNLGLKPEEYEDAVEQFKQYFQT